MNAAESFVETLVRSGVTKFFGLPGSTEAPLLEALRASGEIDYVLSLHEVATVAMADGYARIADQPGVVGLHTTVGTMNGMSQLFNAYRDSSPVVMTAGHKDRTVLAEDAFAPSPISPVCCAPSPSTRGRRSTPRWSATTCAARCRRRWRRRAGRASSRCPRT